MLPGFIRVFYEEQLFLRLSTLALRCHKKVEPLDRISLCMHIKNLMFAFGGTFSLLKEVV